uniref:Uncharacterized protein n=1 Tax=Panstrongylus lignarius TaxID=156445 RepID=A0A224XQP5_9HEMI
MPQRRLTGLALSLPTLHSQTVLFTCFVDSGLVFDGTFLAFWLTFLYSSFVKNLSYLTPQKKHTKQMKLCETSQSQFINIHHFKGKISLFVSQFNTNSFLLF